MSPILKLKRHNQEKEIAFELKYLKSLSVKKRFELMFKKNQELLDLLEASGHKRPDFIMKRAAARPQDLEDLKRLKKL